VHRPFGQQRQDGCPHVTAASAAGTAATPSAATAAAETEPGPETGTEAGAEPRAETWPEALIAGVIAEVFAEFPSGLPPGVMQGTPSPASGWCPQCRTGVGADTESEARTTGEWSAGGSEWIGHCLKSFESR
jgi:hypothetical protein